MLTEAASMPIRCLESLDIRASAIYRIYYLLSIIYYLLSIDNKNARKI